MEGLLSKGPTPSSLFGGTLSGLQVWNSCILSFKGVCLSTFYPRTLVHCSGLFI